MTVQFNVKNPEGLKKGDILIYNGEKFDIITVDEIVGDLKKEVVELKSKVETLNRQNKKVKADLNAKINAFLSAFQKKVK